MSHSEVLVRARGLTKRFGDFTAVDGIDFDLYRGEAFGFLGPNGAGKSSTMRMIGCVSPPSGGELTILGRDPVRDGSAIRARLGVVPQEDTLDVELTVRENLLVYGRYFGLPRRVIRERTDALLDFVQLSDRARDKVDPLSGGLKRRLTIARSLINEPEILILDEPTTGLDPQARHVVWDRLFRLKQRGVTLILTTHYMDEAEQLCDRLVVMDHGRFAAEGSPRDLIARYCSPEVLELRFDPDLHELAVDKLKDFPAERAEVLADRILLYVTDGDDALAAVRSTGLEPLTSLVRRGTLEDVFLRLTGRRWRTDVGGSADPGPDPPGWPSSSLSFRAYQCWLTVYRRIWRSSIWSTVLGPVFYLGALGFGLGTLVNRHGTASLGGVSYLAFVAPAILASGAMNTAMGEASYPVFGSIKWNRIYIAAQASPLRPGDIFRGHLMFMTMRIAMNAALVTVYIWAFGATQSAWVVLAWPGRDADRARLRRPDRGLGRHAEDRELVRLPVPVRHDAADAVLRHVLPAVPAARLAARCSPTSRRCGTASPCAACSASGRRPAPGARPRRLPGRAVRRRDLGRGPHLPQAALCLAPRCGCCRRPGCSPGSSGRAATRAACA